MGRNPSNACRSEMYKKMDILRILSCIDKATSGVSGAGLGEGAASTPKAMWVSFSQKWSQRSLWIMAVSVSECLHRAALCKHSMGLTPTGKALGADGKEMTNSTVPFLASAQSLLQPLTCNSLCPCRQEQNLLFIMSLLAAEPFIFFLQSEPLFLTPDVRFNNSYLAWTWEHHLVVF